MKKPDFLDMHVRRDMKYSSALEKLRKDISKASRENDGLYFTMRNLDLLAFYKVYQNDCPAVIKCLYQEHGENIKIPDHVVHICSPLVTLHPRIEKFNDLFAELIGKDGSITKDIERLKRHQDAKMELGRHITDDIKMKFIKCLEVNVKVQKKLIPNIDTLFFVCLYYYNLLWDTYGLTFNGPIAENGLKDLPANAQPFDFRATSQVNFLASVLYDYYRFKDKTSKLTLTLGRKNIAIDDPQIAEFFVRAIENDLPASTGYYGSILLKLIESRKHSNHEAWLKELKKLTNLPRPNYQHTKRKVLKEFCVKIHPIFSYYLDLDVKTFSGQRVKIYDRILKTFGMEDFSILKKDLQTNGKSKRSNSSENRLGTLLRERRSASKQPSL